MSPLAVVVVSVIGVTGLLFLIRGIGFWLAATHPAPEVPADMSSAPLSIKSGEAAYGVLAAVIAAAVHETMRSSVRIISIVPARQPSVEMLMLQWSAEGRRAIYSSHRVR